MGRARAHGRLGRGPRRRRPAPADAPDRIAAERPGSRPARGPGGPSALSSPGPIGGPPPRARPGPDRASAAVRPRGVVAIRGDRAAPLALAGPGHHARIDAPRRPRPAQRPEAARLDSAARPRDRPAPVAATV